MMKRLLGFLLALMMLMTCALAEDQDVNHLLEMCKRVDLLLHNDSMVSDWVTGTDSAIAEENKIINRLRAGDRSMPKAIFFVSEETVKEAFVAGNDAYDNSEEQRTTLVQIPQQVLLKQLDEYGQSMLGQLTRQTNYLSDSDEPVLGLYFVLYDDALPMLGCVNGDGRVNVLYCMPIFSDELMKCESAEEVTAWMETVGLPAMACKALDITDAKATEFEGSFQAEATTPIPFDILANAADSMDTMLQNGYLQTVWGVSDEDAAKMDVLRHNGSRPRQIFRVELVNSTSAAMMLLRYRNADFCVQHEAMSSWTMRQLEGLLYQSIVNAIDDGINALTEEFNISSEDESIYSDTEKQDLLEQVENLYEEYTLLYAMISYSSRMEKVTGLPDESMAMYLLIYDEGAPIAAIVSQEYGVTMLNTCYIYSKSIANCKNVSDITLVLNGMGMPFEVTEITNQTEQ